MSITKNLVTYHLCIFTLNRPYIINHQVDKKPDESSLAKAATANSEYEKLLGYCTSGGGKRGMERHTVKNKKIFVRERIARYIHIHLVASGQL